MEKNFEMGIRGADSLGKLEPIERSVPSPGPGEVLIRVEKAGVAFGDIMRSEGKVMKVKHFPMVPGYDTAGIITEIGPAVEGFAPGDKVGAYTQTGGYARYVVARVQNCLKLPEGLGMAEAAAVNLNYVTALQMLRRAAKVNEGERIYIDSAAGGVGTAVLDLSRNLGLRAYGSCSHGKLEIVRSFGAEAVDREAADFSRELQEKAGAGFDAAFESLGPGSAYVTREYVRKGGRLVLFGFVKTRSSKHPMAEMLGVLGLYLRHKGRRFVLYGINPFKQDDWFREDYGYLLEQTAAGKLKPLIDSEFPLAKAREAHAKLLSGKTKGKIILDCTGY